MLRIQAERTNESQPLKIVETKQLLTELFNRMGRFFGNLVREKWTGNVSHRKKNRRK